MMGGIYQISWKGNVLSLYWKEGIDPITSNEWKYFNEDDDDDNDDEDGLTLTEGVEKILSMA